VSFPPWDAPEGLSPRQHPSPVLFGPNSKHLGRFGLRRPGARAILRRNRSPSSTAEVVIIEASLEQRERLLSLSLDTGERDASDWDDDRRLTEVM